MKRLLTFNFADGDYIIQENSSTIFSINGNNLKFDSLKFYKGVYKGDNRTTLIEFKNKLTKDPLKKGNYIYEWINDIIIAIRDEFNESDIEELEPENKQVNLRRIPLYDMAACAGNGLYIGEEDVPYTEYDVNNNDADYAVKISGHSMEPTISDGSIVLVKRIDKLENEEIGIFYLNGDSMCKRYSEINGNKSLIPDNKEFEKIEITSDVNCVIQGKVISIS